MTWVICNATLGEGKNKLLIRGIEGAEWVFCPIAESIRDDKVPVSKCKECPYFVKLQETSIVSTRRRPPFRVTKRK